MEIEEENTELSQGFEEEEKDSHLLPEELKWAIVYKKKEGKSNKKVASEIRDEYKRSTIKHQQVKAIWEKYEAIGDVLNLWSGGRPKILEPEEEEALVQSCLENRIISDRERGINLGLEASRQTINRTLLDKGYKSYKAKSRYLIKPENVALREEFAKKYSRWRGAWNKVIFSDECRFMVLSSNGRVHIRRKADEFLEPGTFQFYDDYADSFMLWGAISSEGIGPLVRIGGTLNAETYLGILRYRLGRYFPGLINGTQYFQQDNASCHKADIVLNWFQARNIRCLEWPPQSADLNIIEDIWNFMKFEMRTLVFENLEDLWREVQRVWRIIPLKLIQGLYTSFPRRIEAVLEAHGGITKY